MSFAFPYLSGRTLSLPFSILEEAIYSPQVDTLYLLEQLSLEKDSKSDRRSLPIIFYSFFLLLMQS